MTGVNVKKLKGKMVENDISMAQLAEMLGLNTATLYRKFNNNGQTMLIRDANGIVDALKLTKEEAVAIFFSQIVA